ncbi:MAG: hypothetical protein L0H64_10880 [Pseudonocardia sp.]|nr:hypothetical protein [Pseudonocardia sp.]
MRISITPCTAISQRTGAPAAPTAELTTAPRFEAQISSPKAMVRVPAGTPASARVAGTSACAAPRQAAADTP